MTTILILQINVREGYKITTLEVIELIEDLISYLDSLLDSDNYCLDSSLDINSKDDLKDEEATTAKDLAREQKERLKALLNAKQSLCKSRDGNRTLHSRRLTDAYILYFKELLSNNSRIFANAIGIGKTRAIVLAVLIEHVYFKN
ncbi:hypothetical protein HBH64_249270 [Parastagonospora nodorum]|nr:hypothetical protein HBI02_248640 [Parastagonospora nodorum]KAH4285574.1 hypothetical protein HBI01_249880 [Parastagonospora nodorum]KAH4319413.1 hypothetical protein HBI00_248900 [Parastagonospora nodorum]KAH4354370.1 hypothetical protein HBH94_250070 [Parastagonospora nodorum]KAH4436928.1 hypothetical protein HBH90_248430 [Parastagonospora nodorum]